MTIHCPMIAFNLFDLNPPTFSYSEASILHLIWFIMVEICCKEQDKYQRHNQVSAGIIHCIINQQMLVLNSAMTNFIGFILTNPYLIV